MQNDLLEKNPTANVEVYAVWLPMVRGDARAAWPATLLTDPRVQHFWDEDRIAGAWYAKRTPSMRDWLTPESKWSDGEVLWDTYLLYGADSRWQDAPTELIHWGRTVIAAKDTLAKAFDQLFSP